MANFSDFLEQKLLGHTLLGSTYTAPATVYYSLATSIASDGSSYTEVTTNLGYTRQAVDFSEPTSGPAWSAVNSATLAMGTATTPWGTVAHFAIFDDAAIGGGNMLYWGDQTTPRAVLSSDVVEVQAGNLSVRLD